MPFVLQNPHLRALAQLLHQAPVVRSHQLQRAYFIPRIDDFQKDSGTVRSGDINRLGASVSQIQWRTQRSLPQLGFGNRHVWLKLWRLQFHSS
ncbi:hypothetical protein ACSQ67_020207 [Phaseolus vulgaris]